MAAESPESVARQAQAPRVGWRDWLQVLVVACALLALSEALWLWQTWPVRELLRTVTTQAAGGR